MEPSEQFPSLREYSLEIRLSAWLDGETNDEESLELEALVNSNDEARHILDQLIIGSEFGMKAFAAMLDEPVPLPLVRAVKENSEKKTSIPARADLGKAVIARNSLASRDRRAANSNSSPSFMPKLAAASIMFLIAGGYSAFHLSNPPVGILPAEISEAGVTETSKKTRGFNVPANPDAGAGTVQDVEPAQTFEKTLAGYYKSYIDENLQPSRATGDTDKQAIRSQLSEASGVKIVIPDLTADNFQLSGARVFSTDGRSIAALFYHNDQGQILMIGSKLPENRPERSLDYSKVSWTSPVSHISDLSIGSGMNKGVQTFVVVPADVSNSKGLIDKIITGM